MPPRSNNIRGVHVSNVPYDMTEEQLAHIMGEAGPVAQTRLAFHQDTGRPKGFGYVDYYAETAASAVRNLNGTLVAGRPLGVAFQSEGDSAASGSGDSDPIHALLNNPPAGRIPDRGINSTDAISQTLAAIPPGQLEEVLGRMKALVMSQPGEAKELLTKNPQLGYALFQSMLMMNLVDASVIQRMMAASVPTGGAPPPPAQNQPQQSYPSYPPPAPSSASSYPVHPSRAAALPPPPPSALPLRPHQGGPPPPQHNNHGNHSPYPPQQNNPSSYPPQNPSYPPPHQAYPPANRQPPPPPPPQAQPGSDVPVAIRHLPQEQQTQIMAVLRMPQSQVDMLPAEQKAQIMQLRTTIGAIV